MNEISNVNDMPHRHGRESLTYVLVHTIHVYMTIHYVFATNIRHVLLKVPSINLITGFPSKLNNTVISTPVLFVM